VCQHSPMGATGYRVRWGTVSGSYPHSSPVLPADARQWSITGLVTGADLLRGGAGGV